MKTRHDGDCSIYAASDNKELPESGICTCGYGHWLRGEASDDSKMYSGRLLEKLKQRAVIAREEGLEWQI